MKSFPKGGHLQLCGQFFLHHWCPLIGENTVFLAVVTQPEVLEESIRIFIYQTEQTYVKQTWHLRSFEVVYLIELWFQRHIQNSVKRLWCSFLRKNLKISIVDCFEKISILHIWSISECTSKSFAVICRNG